MRQRMFGLVILLAFFVMTGDLAKGQPPGFDVDEGPVLSLAWSPDGKRLAYCEAQHCRVVDAANFKTLANVDGTMSVETGSGQGVIGFGPDGKDLLLPATGDHAGDLISVWNAQTGASEGSLRQTGPLPGPSAWMFSQSADRGVLAGLSLGNDPVMIYAMPGRNLLGKVSMPKQGGLKVIALSADGRVLATDRGNNAIMAVDVATGAARGAVSYDLDWQVAPIRNLGFSPDGQYLAAGFSNGGVVQVPGQGNTLAVLPSPWPTAPIWLWRVRQGVPFGAPRKLCGKQPQGVLSMIWQPDSQALIFADGYGATRICRLDGSPATTLTDSGAKALDLLAISPDGQRLAVGGDSRITILALDKLQ